MDDAVGSGGNRSDDDRRRLKTPARVLSRCDQDENSRSRSRSRHLREWERELECERQRIHLLERELQRERDVHNRRQRSNTRGLPSGVRGSGLRRLSPELRCGEPHQPSLEPRPSRSRRVSTELRQSRSHRRSPAARRGSDRTPHKNADEQQKNFGEKRGADCAAVHNKLRSRSPSFSTNDIVKILSSLKGGLSSQLIDQGAHSYSKSLDCKNIVPEFNPCTKNQRIDIWLKKVNECASVYGWDEKTTTHFAMQKLQGLAKTWYESLNSILFTWPEWQEKLLSAFPCEQNYGQSLEDMLRRKSRINEPIEIYYYEKLALINQCEITGKKAVDCIIHGISDRTMKSGALALRCSAPDQLLQFLLSNKDMAPTLQAIRNIGRNFNSTGTPDSHSNFRSNSRAVSNSQNVYCFNCKEKGHPYLRCPKPLLKCDRCSKIGHKIENCVTALEKGSTNGDTAKKTMQISSSNPSAKFIKEVSVNGLLLDAFVDLGSEVTIIQESTMSLLGVTHDGVPSTMKGFGNGLVQSLGSVLLKLSIDGVGGEVSCRVVKDYLLDKPVLIGQTFTELSHIIIYKDAMKLQFLSIDVETPAPDPNDIDERLVRVRVADHCEIYGAASIKANTEHKFTGNILLNSKIVGKPNDQVLVSGGVYQVNNGSLAVTVTPYSIPCFFQENAVFARGERVQVVNRINDILPDVCLTSDVSVDHIDETHLRIGDSVPTDLKHKLINLLQRYKRCFANDLNGLGCTGVTEMQIEINSQRPIVYRPYRLSHHERGQVRDMISEMLDAGVIRESKSNYASPIILVKKKDGKTRLCIDYRMLNSITTKERYPMPIIEDEIARLSGQAWFNTLDLMSGYYQVPISEASKHLTAFVTPDGQYEFNRMPFGLANAPAIFQRMMNQVLGPARFEKAMVYIDDLLVFATTAEESLSRLEEVLQLLENSNLKLNLAKCSFLQTKIDYLGYEITSAGVRPGETKIKSVAEFPRPENVHGVRQFLGLVSYFRKFIPGFAQIAFSLTNLLKKDAVWTWAEQQENAFETLKSKLINRPVLSIFDPTAETELHTDASRVGIGGILVQRIRGNNSFQPVAFYSRQTTPEEKNFHSYELETLAVVCSLKKFRVYLMGKEFKIVTDCSALRSTFQKRDLIPRIARWWLALQEFNCSVEYRAGTKMSHVDALSRNPTSDPEQCPSVMSISNDDWLLTLQLGDSELGRIRNILSSNLDSTGLDYIKDSYLLRNNKLYRRIGDGENDIRWVVPKGARWQLCRMNHDDIGHVGVEKTLERLKKNYWFSKMSRFVKKYVGACIECAYAKRSNNSREGLLHPIIKVEIPFHTLHIDHLGPFVRSKRGHSHILVIVDSFTKFVFIKPVRNTKTQGVIKVLTDIFDTFRAPDRIISDRGSCFTSHSFKRFCLSRGVKHVLNTVASPRSNGQVERYNRTILDSLTAQNLRDDEKDWDEKTGKIQWGLNNTVQKTTGRAPAEIMFGTTMSSEVNPTLNEIAGEIRKEDDITILRQGVKKRIEKEQEYQKRYYDIGKRPARIYNKGDLVKITKTAFQNNGKSTKLLPSYEGPYRVVKILGNDRYKVAPIPGFEGTKRKLKTTVAADRMQPWINIMALHVNDDDSESE